MTGRGTGLRCGNRRGNRLGNLLFRFLIALLPGRFKREFGDDLLQMYLLRSREFRSDRFRQRLQFQIHECLDMGRTLGREWRLQLTGSGEGRNKGSRAMDGLIQDVRFGSRMLVRNPLFSLAAILCLALGIGANASIFSFFYRVVADPLPYAQARRLMFIQHRNTADQSTFSASYPEYLDLRERSRTFEGLMACGTGEFTITGGSEPVRVSGAVISHNFASILRIAPALGRSFTAEEEMPGAPPVVLIGFGLWHDRFGGDPDLVGESVLINSEPYTVIGIMPRRFAFPDIEEIWMPIRSDPATSRERYYLNMVGRLRPGITLETARTELAGLASHCAELNPGFGDDLTYVTVPLSEQYIAENRQYTMIFYAVVTLVLLLACANVANLMLARTTARRQEIAIRSSLGGGRVRIVRMLLTESLLLALAGGGLGIVLGRLGHRLILTGIPAEVPFYLRSDWSPPVVLGLAGICVLCGLLFGLAPALTALRTDPAAVLQSGEDRATAGIRSSRLRSALVVAEVSLALIVLVGAGLMMKSFVQLRSIDPGFDADNVLTLEIDLPTRTYRNTGMRNTFWAELIPRIQGVPGIEQVCAAAPLPMDKGTWGRLVSLDQDGADADDPVFSIYQSVFSGYFRTMRIPLLHGRAFSSDDMTGTAPPIMIVSRSFAETAWPGENPIGKRVSGGDGYEVIGVVEDIRWRMRRPVRPMHCYLPIGRETPRTLHLVARTTSEPQALMETIRNEIWAVDPDLPVDRVRTMNQIMRRTNWEPTLFVSLFGIFSILALILASIGVYGIIAYGVEQRRGEFGIRMALGASHGQIETLVVRQGLRLMAAGLGIGLAAAWVLMRLARTIFFGVHPNDPLIYILMTVAMGSVALTASWLPVRRALKIDPVRILQAE